MAIVAFGAAAMGEGWRRGGVGCDVCVQAAGVKVRVLQMRAALRRRCGEPCLVNEGRRLPCGGAS